MLAETLDDGVAKGSLSFLSTESRPAPRSPPPPPQQEGEGRETSHPQPSCPRTPSEDAPFLRHAPPPPPHAEGDNDRDRSPPPLTSPAAPPAAARDRPFQRHAVVEAKWGGQWCPAVLQESIPEEEAEADAGPSEHQSDAKRKTKAAVAKKGKKGKKASVANRYVPIRWCQDSGDVLYVRHREVRVPQLRATLDLIRARQRSDAVEAKDTAATLDAEGPSRPLPGSAPEASAAPAAEARTCVVEAARLVVFVAPSAWPHVGGARGRATEEEAEEERICSRGHPAVPAAPHAGDPVVRARQEKRAALQTLAAMGATVLCPTDAASLAVGLRRLLACTTRAVLFLCAPAVLQQPHDDGGATAVEAMLAAALGVPLVSAAWLAAPALLAPSAGERAVVQLPAWGSPHLGLPPGEPPAAADPRAAAVLYEPLPAADRFLARKHVLFCSSLPPAASLSTEEEARGDNETDRAQRRQAVETVAGELLLWAAGAQVHHWPLQGGGAAPATCDYLFSMPGARLCGVLRAPPCWRCPSSSGRGCRRRSPRTATPASGGRPRRRRRWCRPSCARRRRPAPAPSTRAMCHRSS
ncbi:hypothetical protein STCU_10600 [Strigomonas culicis]|uniref:PI-PLC Y-box domain-containing protein n=1 Tax=Strigomonas culicis TaxID=28005 RepID=S9THB5_9TRYP|nr:hypothetical protein STCU_10600 [Strigomonas culicis]|eukprot:EPY17457.1 hypothetical protein STCU_10600 [Strigomonas culicis]